MPSAHREVAWLMVAVHAPPTIALGASINLTPAVNRQ